MNIDLSKKFRRNFKKLSSSDQKKTRAIIERLANNEILEVKYHDHALQGEFQGFRECHIKPDLLLIYQKQDETITLYCLDVGSHSELF